MGYWRAAFGTAAAVALAIGAGCGRQGGSASKVAEVEIAIFQGGYGIDFFEQAAREYEAKHPGLKINLWGNPRVWEQLRPRFIGGNPPDFTWPGWGMDHWGLIYEGQLSPLDDYLAEPAYDGKGTWKDAFIPSLLRLGQYEGKQYLLPYHFSMFGWWYDKQMFARLGLQPPKTWSELLAVCAKLKAASIAPITHQGKYPAYMVRGLWIPWAISAGGAKVYEDAQNLVPGAWANPAFLRAAEMIRELETKGYIQQGSAGMTHTEAQMEFIQGRAAMIPCGTWLHSEMEKSLPKNNFEMSFFLPPVLDRPVGDPTAISIGIEPWMLPKESRNPKVGIDYYKYITSLPKAKEFVEKKGSLVAIKGSDQARIPIYLTDALAAFRAAKTVWATQYAEWYQKFGDAINGNMAKMLNGELTPKQFVDAVEADAEKLRKDTAIVKHRVER